MHQNILVVDSFLENPSAARKAASDIQPDVGQKWEGDGGTYYGCRQVPEPLRQEIEAGLSKLFAPHFVKVKLAIYRLATAGQPTPVAIHADSSLAEDAFVLYLSNPSLKQNGGTALWKHRELGLESRYQLMSIDESTARFLNEEGARPERWQMIGLLPERFNRLVSYRADWFHSRWPLEAYGRSFFDGRLVVAGFYDIQYVYSNPAGNTGGPSGDGQAGQPVPEGGQPSTIIPVQFAALGKPVGEVPVQQGGCGTDSCQICGREPHTPPNRCQNCEI